MTILLHAARRSVLALATAALALCTACGADARHPLGLAIDTGGATFAVGTRSGVLAWEVFSDGSSDMVTDLADWVSSAPSVATVTRGAGVAQVEALAPGTVAITASYDGLSATVTFDVQPR